MSAWGALGPGTRMIVLTLGGVATAGVGYLGWQALWPDDASVAVQDAGEVVAPAASAPEAAPAADTVKPAADPLPEAVAAPDPDLPKIDTWRVAPDGEALVAGHAAPGAKIEVVVDDVPVAEGITLASGEFVLQFTLPPNPDPSLLWLSMTSPDGVAVASPEMVALGPIAGTKLAEVSADSAPDSAEAKVAGTGDTTAPAALLLTDDGAVVLQDAAPADPAFAAQVMIDTISYAPTGEVQVGGRGARGALLRLYLDNAEVASADIPDDGRWLVTLSDTAPGIYTLRVDQLDKAGLVTSRFETPFQRETLDALAEAVKADPAPAVEPVAAAAPAATEDPAVSGSEPAPKPPAGAATVEVAAADPAPAAGPAPEAPTSVTITVQPGFTLWGIAQDRLGDGVLYVKVFEANRDTIKDPDLIYPGQVVSIPAATTP